MWHGPAGPVLATGLIEIMDGHRRMVNSFDGGGPNTKNKYKNLMTHTFPYILAFSEGARPPPEPMWMVELNIFQKLPGNSPRTPLFLIPYSMDNNLSLLEI